MWGIKVSKANIHLLLIKDYIYLCIYMYIRSLYIADNLDLEIGENKIYFSTSIF